MKHGPLLTFFASSLLMLNSCKNDDTLPSAIPEDNSTTRAAILSDISSHVIAATYAEMSSKAAEFEVQIVQLQGVRTDANLNACRTKWREIRAAWEQSEGFLFGPVATENIDPRIDTWPVNHSDLDSILSTSVVFDDSYIDGLQDALKGFHPIEYLMFGVDGAKAASALTDRELDFLHELSKNLKALTVQVASNWTVGSGSYYIAFTKAGNGSVVYTTQRAAFEELVDAIVGICDEVGGGKIAAPFDAMDPTLEESPYAKNSLADFRHNMMSVRNIYTGKFNTDGKGLEDFVRVHNLSLDATIKQQLTDAINSLDAIPVPFGEAIITQRPLVQQSINKIEALKTTLESGLLPLVQLKIQ